ncbi:MAG: hypothetical protein HPY69_18595 [Armatimonadetes bacterium]|nr:hypothetical protein [Armatimonadota bacterium]
MDETLEAFWQEEVATYLPDPAAAVAAALEYVCCPVCEVLAHVPFDFFSRLPVRWPKEPDLQRAVIEAGGFCNHHSWRLANMQSQAAVALVFVDVMAALSEHGPLLTGPCAVCRLEAIFTERLLDALVEHLQSQSNQERFAQLFGLCYPHWRELLGRDLPASLRDLLLSSQSRYARQLRQHLQGFLDKNTPALKQTRTQDESRAARRAILKTAGNENI